MKNTLSIRRNFFSCNLRLRLRHLYFQLIFTKLITNVKYVSFNKKFIIFQISSVFRLGFARDRVTRRVLISNISAAKMFLASYWLSGPVIDIVSIVQQTTNKNMNNNIILISVPNFHRFFYTIFPVQNFYEFLVLPRITHYPPFIYVFINRSIFNFTCSLFIENFLFQ